MSFEKLNLKILYRSDSDKVYEDFFEKCISESISYDRAVGYFSSGFFKLVLKGLEKFVEKDGKIRIITSPQLNEEDIEAIIKNQENKFQEDIILKFKKIINESDMEGRDLLGLLIEMEKIEIKIAYKKNFLGIYHEKFGVFKDEKENKIAFTGSINETLSGYSENFESIDVYNSLDGKREKQRIEEKEKAFENLWNNNTEKIEVIDFPEALRNEIIKNISPKCRDKIMKYRKTQENNLIIKIPEGFKIREYQKEAFEKWKANGGKGILNMATGTGKTITAIYIMDEVYKILKNKNRKTFYLIICPQKQLVFQWKEELKLFNFKNVVTCDSDNKNWVKELKELFLEHYYDDIENFVILTTNKSFLTERFQNIFTSSLYDTEGMIIVDECHNIGSENYKNYILDNKLEKIKLRLGLSATPERRDNSNEIIHKFLGEEVFKFDLKRAIEEGFLTRYNYYPIFVTFNLEEEENYIIISEKIKKLTAILENGGKNKKELKEQLEQLNFKRARIIQNLQMKEEKCIEFFKNNLSIKNTLVYVGTGKDKNNIKMIDNLLEKLKKYIKIEKFTAEESSEERQRVIEDFKNEFIQGILAIKCLDEGINIPNIKTAVILASTGNPKEYIQRRGRILRKAPGKEIAEIYDFMVVPRSFFNMESYFSRENYHIDKLLLKKEFERVNEFMSLAENKLDIHEKLIKLKYKYNI